MFKVLTDPPPRILSSAPSLLGERCRSSTTGAEYSPSHHPSVRRGSRIGCSRFAGNDGQQFVNISLVRISLLFWSLCVHQPLIPLRASFFEPSLGFSGARSIVKFYHSNPGLCCEREKKSHTGKKHRDPGSERNKCRGVCNKTPNHTRFRLFWPPVTFRGDSEWKS